MNTKTCTKCIIEKPATTEFFGKMRRGKYGLDSMCKSCKCKAMRIYKQKPEVKSRRNEIAKERRKNDTRFKILGNLRTRLYNAIKGNVKSEPTLKLLGCTVEYLVSHLENQFAEGMNWDNYGEWHVDHITPCASFDLSDPEQQKRCFHYSNLQPLWAEENLLKSDSITYLSKHCH